MVTECILPKLKRKRIIVQWMLFQQDIATAQTARKIDHGCRIISWFGWLFLDPFPCVATFCWVTSKTQKPFFYMYKLSTLKEFKGSCSRQDRTHRQACCRELKLTSKSASRSALLKTIVRWEIFFQQFILLNVNTIWVLFCRVIKNIFEALIVMYCLFENRSSFRASPCTSQWWAHWFQILRGGVRPACTWLHVSLRRTSRRKWRRGSTTWCFCRVCATISMSTNGSTTTSTKHCAKRSSSLVHSWKESCCHSVRWDITWESVFEIVLLSKLENQ